MIFGAIRIGGEIGPDGGRPSGKRRSSRRRRENSTGSKDRRGTGAEDGQEGSAIRIHGNLVPLNLYALEFIRY